MAKSDVGSLVAAGGGGGFRLWAVFSTAAFRRKLLEAVVCGGGGGVSRQRTDFESPEPAAVESKRSERSDHRLGELLRAEISNSAPSDESEKEIKRKVQFLDELQSVVKRLQVEDLRKEAASEVRRLAKDNAEARETLAMLGAIPPLAGMIDFCDHHLQVESLYALLNLGIGNDANKAAIVKAGTVHKMLNLIESGCSQSLSEAIVANFLGLSALDSNKAIIGASGAILFLATAFRDAEPGSQSRLDSLRSLFNLSISPLNAPHLVESKLVPCLFAAIGDMEVSEKVLSVLSNLVGSPEGRRAVSRSPEAIPILVDVLNWGDSPECQEKAAYILMIMAYKAAYKDRAAMIEVGIVSSLLELTLIGSPLAQKRASRVLEILRADKGKQTSEGFVGCNEPSSGAPPVSAPLCSGQPEGEEEEDEEMGISEERRAVKELVQQSLQSNMRRIVRRANLPQDFAPSDRLMAVTGSSATSKSLPF